MDPLIFMMVATNPVVILIALSLAILIGFWIGRFLHGKNHTSKDLLDEYLDAMIEIECEFIQSTTEKEVKLSQLENKPLPEEEKLAVDAAIARVSAFTNVKNII